MKHGKGKSADIRVFGNKINRNTRRLIFAALFVPALAGAIIASLMLLINYRESRAAKDEYEGLRKHSPMATETSAPPPFPSPSPSPSSEPDIDEEPVVALPETPEQVETLLNLNPDYIGWIKIDGTGIDYPVVQGRDNVKYINTTFMGENNRAGAIFMDRRCADTFGSHFAVLYGHNRNDGSMFTALHDYEDEAYLKANQNIRIATLEGETLTYRIFAARLTTVHDELFSLFGKSKATVERYFDRHDAPEGAQRFLVLSTCTFGGSDDDRLLIFAAITKRNTPTPELVQ